MRHGGLLASLTSDLFLAPTRAPYELSVSHRLRDGGVSTPAVLAYVTYAAGPLLRRADVVTREIPNASDLGTLLESGAPAAPPAAALWDAVAVLVEDLARVGAYHADLNVKNVLVGPDAHGGLRAYAIECRSRRVGTRRRPGTRPGEHRPSAAIGTQARPPVTARVPPPAAYEPASADSSTPGAPVGTARLGPRSISLDRVGIVMMSAVGDAVHVLPLLNALKRQAPASRVTWVLQPAPATLVRGHPAVDDIVVFDRAQGWRGFASVRRALRERPFDLVLDLQVYFKAGIVTAFTRAPVKLGFDRARARDANWLFTTHRIRRAIDGPARAGPVLRVPRRPARPSRPVGSDMESWPLAVRACGPAGVLLSGSIGRPRPSWSRTSKPHKDWLPERWADVARALYADFGLQPVLVGGTSTREQQAAAIVRARVPEVAVGAGQRPPRARRHPGRR